MAENTDPNLDPNNIAPGGNNDGSGEGEGSDNFPDEAGLWADIEQAEAAATDDPNATPSDDKTGDNDGDWGQQGASADGDGDQNPANQGAGDQPPPKQGPSDGKPSDAAQAPDPETIWKGAPPELRASYEDAQQQIKKLEQADRSNRGRLSALQRQINELMRQGSPAAHPGAAENQGEGDDDLDVDLKAVAEEYPEVATPFVKRFEKQQVQITRLEKELAAIGDERRQSALNEQKDLLVAEHPDWETIAGEQEFSDWVYAQPRHIIDAAERNANTIVDAFEAADLIGRFKEYRRANQQGGAQQGAGNKQQLSGKRQRQLESASGARSGGPGAASGIPEDGDPEVLWAQFDAMEQRQARG